MWGRGLGFGPGVCHRRVSQGCCITLGAGMARGGGSSAAFLAAASSLAARCAAAMAAWLSSAALDAAFAYAAALFGAGYAGGGGTASGPCANFAATRLAAQSRAIAPMSPAPIIDAAGAAACTGVSAELPHTPPVTWVPCSECRERAFWRGQAGRVGIMLYLL